MDKYQLTVIGGGPGGYTAALRGAALGLKTLLVEKIHLGGICLNHGCIPTKSLVHSAKLYKNIKGAAEFGLTTGEVGFSFSKIQEKKNSVVQTLVGGVDKLLKGAGVKVLSGSASLVSPTEVEVILVSGEKINVVTEKIILAPGSEEARPPIPGVDLPGILTSKEALALDEVPTSLAILGGGVIALEMASIYATFGSRVTIVQRSVLLRREDSEMVRRLTPYLRKMGIKIMTQTKVKEITAQDKGYALQLETRRGEETLPVESVLVAVGRKPSIGLGANVGVKQDVSGILVNKNMETNVPGIYAVGDAASPSYYLAHVASHQGVVAAENAAGLQSVFNDSVIPVCIFTQPELSRAGLTEDEAKEKGIKVKVGKFPFTANGKAFLQGEGEGVVKIIADAQDGRVLGMHILGPNASDLIQEGALAIYARVKSEEMADLIHPHPTLSEAIWEASLAIDKAPIHMGMR